MQAHQKYRLRFERSGDWKSCSSGYTYLWSPAAGLDNPTLAQPTATLF
ncbi:MAG: hypothetical protein IPJ31_15075 [Bacteroidetes bacterium]|nr:hypothetical protein [Bacteroidota bacterium]